VLATAATVIAKPGGDNRRLFADRQAVQLGLLPRFEVRYTSETHAGQIYLAARQPAAADRVLLLVLLFRTSSGLASAYGIAVSTTMVADGIMGFVVIWKLWKLARATAAAVILAVRRGRHDLLQRQSAKAARRRLVPLLFGS